MRHAAHDLAQAARLIELSIGKLPPVYDNALKLALPTVQSAATLAGELAATERQAADHSEVIDP